MATLKETKSRIASVQGTLKITTAMKMVSSAKLHHAQNAIGNMIPYEQGLRRILATLLGGGASLASLGVNPRYLHAETDDSRHRRRAALVVISSNSSLCGSFNSNVVKLFSEQMDLMHKEGLADDEIDIYPIGRKIHEAVRKAGFAPKGEYSSMADKPSYDQTVALADELCRRYLDGTVDEVRLVYNHFASTASQPSVCETFLPFAMDSGAGDGGAVCDYILEPGAEELASELLPKVLKLKFYTALLDANAAEHAARVVAMQIASDNAEDLIQQLTLEYNKRRQQAITSELLDIVSGSMS